MHNMHTALATVHSPCMLANQHKIEEIRAYQVHFNANGVMHTIHAELVTQSLQTLFAGRKQWRSYAHIQSIAVRVTRHGAKLEIWTLKMKTRKTGCIIYVSLSCTCLFGAQDQSMSRPQLFFFEAVLELNPTILGAAPHDAQVIGNDCWPSSPAFAGCMRQEENKHKYGHLPATRAALKMQGNQVARIQDNWTTLVHLGLCNGNHRGCGVRQGIPSRPGGAFNGIKAFAFRPLEGL